MCSSWLKAPTPPFSFSYRPPELLLNVACFEPSGRSCGLPSLPVGDALEIAAVCYNSWKLLSLGKMSNQWLYSGGSEREYTNKSIISDTDDQCNNNTICVSPRSSRKHVSRNEKLETKHTHQKDDGRFGASQLSVCTRNVTKCSRVLLGGILTMLLLASVSLIIILAVPAVSSYKHWSIKNQNYNSFSVRCTSLTPNCLLNTSAFSNWFRYYELDILPVAFATPIDSSATQSGVEGLLDHHKGCISPNYMTSQLVANNTTQSEELLVAAEDGSVHLVSSAGELKWSRNLSNSRQTDLKEHQAVQPNLHDMPPGGASAKENVAESPARLEVAISGQVYYRGDTGDTVPLPIHVKDVVSHSPFSTRLFPTVYFLGKREAVVDMLEYSTGAPFDPLGEFVSVNETLRLASTRWMVRAIDAETHLERWRLEWREVTPILHFGENVKDDVDGVGPNWDEAHCPDKDGGCEAAAVGPTDGVPVMETKTIMPICYFGTEDGIGETSTPKKPGMTCVSSGTTGSAAVTVPALTEGHEEEMTEYQKFFDGRGDLSSYVVQQCGRLSPKLFLHVRDRELMIRSNDNLGVSIRFPAAVSAVYTLHRGEFGAVHVADKVMKHRASFVSDVPRTNKPNTNTAQRDMVVNKVANHLGSLPVSQYPTFFSREHHHHHHHHDTDDMSPWIRHSSLMDYPFFIRVDGKSQRVYADAYGPQDTSGSSRIHSRSSSLSSQSSVPGADDVAVFIFPAVSVVLSVSLSIAVVIALWRYMVLSSSGNNGRFLFSSVFRSLCPPLLLQLFLPDQSILLESFNTRRYRSASCPSLLRFHEVHRPSVCLYNPSTEIDEQQINHRVSRGESIAAVSQFNNSTFVHRRSPSEIPYFRRPTTESIDLEIEIQRNSSPFSSILYPAPSRLVDRQRELSFNRHCPESGLLQPISPHQFGQPLPPILHTISTENMPLLERRKRQRIHSLSSEAEYSGAAVADSAASPRRVSRPASNTQHYILPPPINVEESPPPLLRLNHECSVETWSGSTVKVTALMSSPNPVISPTVLSGLDHMALPLDITNRNESVTLPPPLGAVSFPVMSAAPPTPQSLIPSGSVLADFVENGRFSRTFKDISLLGQGGFGSVYKVRHRFEPQSPQYAMKFVNLQLKATANISSRRYFREVSANRDLFSRQVVRYFTWWCEEPQFLPSMPHTTKNKINPDVAFGSLRRRKTKSSGKLRRQRVVLRRRRAPGRENQLNNEKGQLAHFGYSPVTRSKCTGPRSTNTKDEDELWIPFSDSSAEDSERQNVRVNNSYRRTVMGFAVPTVFAERQSAYGRNANGIHSGSVVKKPPKQTALSRLQVDEDDEEFIVFEDSEKIHCVTSASEAVQKKHSVKQTKATPAVTEKSRYEVTLLIQMELVSGVTLRQWLDRPERSSRVEDIIASFQQQQQQLITTSKNDHRDDDKPRLATPVEVALFRQLVKGLRDIHTHGIVHRDIKPENIFVNQNPLTLRIGDFGLARFIDKLSDENAVTSSQCTVEDETWRKGRRKQRKNRDSTAVSRGVDSVLSVKGLLIGTPGYTAPEGGALCTEKADVYSAALIFLELLCPRFETAMERLQTLERFRTYRKIPEHITTHLSGWGELICKMGAVNPKSRPSADAVYRTIKLQLNTMIPSEYPSSTSSISTPRGKEQVLEAQSSSTASSGILPQESLSTTETSHHDIRANPLEQHSISANRKSAPPRPMVKPSAVI